MSAEPAPSPRDDREPTILRIADTSADGEVLPDRSLTEAMVSRIEELRASGELREMLDPLERAKFDEWNVSEGY